jgi:SAM-dependent methyltransferase
MPGPGINIDAADPPLKQAVRDFWQKSACGEVYAQGDSLQEQLDAQARARYDLEPCIWDFARFAQGRGRDVLEVGVGMGADHLEWAKAAPRSLAGVDLTPRAIEFTRARLALCGLHSRLFVADAESLPFADASFDLVYSWGVLHHTPETARAIEQVRRVLRPGGTARVMIYHARSLVGGLLWLRYGLLAGRPARPLAEIYAQHLESPGTKAYSVSEARQLFGGFSQVEMRPQLSVGDLLEGAAGERYSGALLSLARALWPRPLIRRTLGGHGLFLLIEAVK